MKKQVAIFAVGATGAAGRDFAAALAGSEPARRNSNRVSIFVALLILIAGLQTVHAQVEEGTLWREATITELDVDFGGTGFHARWRVHRCQCGDLYAQAEQVAPDGVVSGELLMVGGQVLLSRGFEGQGEDIEPLIQAPSLMLQLAYAMLNRSQPKGPYAVNEKQAWDVKEEEIDFKLDTGLATGIFPAPWGVKGSGWETAAGHRRFDLVFQFSNPAPGDPEASGSLLLSGDLDFRKQEFPLAETTDLGGWRIQWLSLDDRESEAVPEGLTLKTLRQQVRDL
jgi:hypothetical protein